MRHRGHTLSRLPFSFSFVSWDVILVRGTAAGEGGHVTEVTSAEASEDDTNTSSDGGTDGGGSGTDPVGLDAVVLMSCADLDQIPSPVVEDLWVSRAVRKPGIDTHPLLVGACTRHEASRCISGSFIRAIGGIPGKVAGCRSCRAARWRAGEHTTNHYPSLKSSCL